MRRALALLLVVLLAAPLLAESAPDAPNILAGHEVTAAMPELVLVVTDGLAGVTWSGPLVLAIDGRDSARIALPAASAPLPPVPRRPIWPWLAAIGGALLGGFAAGVLAAR
jgi:hypothetical protein